MGALVDLVNNGLGAVSGVFGAVKDAGSGIFTYIIIGGAIFLGILILIRF